MTSLLQKVGGVNWSTNIPGYIGLACGSAELFSLLPAQYAATAMGICLVLNSLGLIAAKSANVSNAENPGVAKSVK